jgi:hypothetical protein
MNGLGFRPLPALISSIVRFDATFRNCWTIFLSRALAVKPHANQDPAALNLAPRESEFQLALLNGALGIAPLVGRPEAAIPQHDRSAAILAVRNCALEIPVGEGMIFHLDCKPPLLGIEGRTFGDSPGFEDAVDFKPQVEVKPRGRMLLNDNLGYSAARTFVLPLGSAVLRKSRFAP